jgi:hypothetical protein
VRSFANARAHVVTCNLIGLLTQGGRRGGLFYFSSLLFLSLPGPLRPGFALINFVFHSALITYRDTIAPQSWKNKNYRFTILIFSSGYLIKKRFINDAPIENPLVILLLVPLRIGLMNSSYYIIE